MRLELEVARVGLERTLEEVAPVGIQLEWDSSSRSLEWEGLWMVDMMMIVVRAEE